MGLRITTAPERSSGWRKQPHAACMLVLRQDITFCGETWRCPEEFGEGARFPEATCVTEMSIMMACWKHNNFMDSLCSRETKAFYSCVEKAQVRSHRPTDDL
ncbi:hypothetical protein INR49_023081 [Caranx melampygus]|nr:hypothetical protein INR49_023081 [Caranx melampygus]